MSGNNEYNRLEFNITVKLLDTSQYKSLGSLGRASVLLLFWTGSYHRQASWFQWFWAGHMSAREAKKQEEA